MSSILDEFEDILFAAPTGERKRPRTQPKIVAPLIKPRHSEDVRSAAIRLRREGRTIDEVAAQLHVSEASVKRWSRSVKFYTNFDDATKLAALRLRKSGKTTAEIVQLLKVSKSTILAWAKKAKEADSR